MPLTVEDLADHLNTTAPAANTQQHREMTRALNTAVQETARRTGMLDATTVTVTVTDGRLPYVRLASITAAVGAGGAVGDVTGADPLTGVLTGLAPGTWQVTCTGKPWPAALEQSALDWAAHLYDVQRARVEPVDDDEPLPSFSLPNRVEELQRPYVLAGIA